LIPDGFFEIFYLLNPSGRTVALGLTQPLTEMSIRADNLATFVCPLSENLGSLKFLELSRPVWVCTGIAVAFYIPED
jgi:hypothetical protein